MIYFLKSIIDGKSTFVDQESVLRFFSDDDFNCDILEITGYEYIDNLCENLPIDKLKNNMKIVFSCVREIYRNDIEYYNKNLKYIDELINRYNIPKNNIKIIFNKMEDNIDFEYLSIPFFILESLDYKFIDKPVENKKFLFLNGKPHKENRLPLLSGLYLKNMLQHSHFSFFRSVEDCRLFPKIINYYYNNDEIYYNPQLLRSIITENDFINFINYIDKSQQVDDVDMNDFIEKTLMGKTFNIQYYKNTKFSVISETYYDKHFITEKTIKPIYNNHPFIICSSKNYLEYLKSYGFETFNDFFNESYDKYDNLIDRINSIIDTICDIQFDDRINDILLHNKNILNLSVKNIKQNIIDYINE